MIVECAAEECGANFNAVFDNTARRVRIAVIALIFYSVHELSSCFFEREKHT